MTTTDLYSGMNVDAKPSSRVINPPGGRSSNIFGGDDTPPQRQQMREQQQPPQRQAMDQNQNAGGASSYPEQQIDSHQQRDNKKKDRGGPAPFASFEDSGNDADFRSYSVTAYRDAVQQNAAIRNKARGQATSGFNPITHEDGNDSSYADYDQARNQQQRHHNQPVQHRTGKLQQQPTQGKAAAFNPITGEEYPESYGQKKVPEKAQDEEEESTEDENADKKPEENASSTAKATDAPQQQQQQEATTTKKPTIKVRHPPGGASSGLW